MCRARAIFAELDFLLRSANETSVNKQEKPLYNAVAGEV